MKRISIVIGLLAVVTFPAQATLLSRLGGAAAYDTVLDITWLANASALGSGSQPTLRNRAAGYSLTVNGQTIDDWRLASMSVAAGERLSFDALIDCQSALEAVCQDNELGYMLYYNMGGWDSSGTQTVDSVTLTNVQSRYWSSNTGCCSRAWFIDFSTGGQLLRPWPLPLSGWAVRDGDVLQVPEPSTIALMALGLVGVGYRKKLLN